MALKKSIRLPADSIAGYLVEGDAGTRIILGRDRVGLFNEAAGEKAGGSQGKSHKNKRTDSGFKNLKREAKAELKNMRHHATKAYEKALEIAKLEFARESDLSREQYQKLKAQAKEAYERAVNQAKTEYEFTVDMAKDHYRKERPAECDREKIYRDTRIIPKSENSTTVCIIREDSPEMEQIRRMVDGKATS